MGQEERGRPHGEGVAAPGKLPRAVGAGVGLGGEGTLASPGQKGESVPRSRTRATQASPPHIHTTPAPTDTACLPLKILAPLGPPRPPCHPEQSEGSALGQGRDPSLRSG